MCGIYGIYDIEGRGNGLGPVLRKMGNSLSHRGPDDEGIYLSSRFKVDTNGGLRAPQALYY
jgi:asparagine synthetase B (glutamine-hydrolysing)